VRGKDTENLVTHASQYDLVNLTAEQIIENMTYARKVHVALPYLEGKLDEEMWGEWVLPQRVLEEDLCLWRKDLHEMISPVIAGKETTAEVAEAIRAWLWGKTEGAVMKVKYQEVEKRLRSPVEILRGGVAACGELAVLYVSFLRAVGIPARHCCTGWYHGEENWHFYTEYWDNQLKRWVATDDAVISPADKVGLGKWKVLSAHAAPGFNGAANAYFTEDLSALEDVTAHLGAIKPLDFRVEGGGDGGSAQISVWNTLGWRKAALAAYDEEESVFRVSLGQPKGIEASVLLTVVRDGRLSWGFSRVDAEKGCVLDALEPGVCMQWPAKEGGR